LCVSIEEKEGSTAKAQTFTVSQPSGGGGAAAQQIARQAIELCGIYFDVNEAVIAAALAAAAAAAFAAVRLWNSKALDMLTDETVLFARMAVLAYKKPAERKPTPELVS
jgi:hypothetical protein